MTKTPDKRKPSRKRTGGKPQPVASGQEPIAFTPLSLLATIIKCILKEKVTQKELDRICKAYFNAVHIMWDDEYEDKED